MSDYSLLVSEGFNSWIEQSFGRADVELDDQTTTSLTESYQMAVTALETTERTTGRPLAEQGVRMFAEWIAAASLVRSGHNEPSLQPTDIEDFLSATMRILNTLFCGPPV